MTLPGCSAEQDDTNLTWTPDRAAVASSDGTSGDTTAATTGGDPSRSGGGGTPGEPATDAGGSGSDAGGSSGRDAGGSSGRDGDGGSAGKAAEGGDDYDVDMGAADNFSFFVTSYEQLIDLAGTENGFGGDLRYNDAATGLEGADAICQELARRVGFGQLTWKAYLSTSTVNAIERIGSGPWYDFTGTLVANDPSGLTSSDRPAGGCCDWGTYDELGIFHDGSEVDDHDVLTGSLTDGTYAGFSCDDWTSVKAKPSSGALGARAGHMWPAQSGTYWGSAHAVLGCRAGTIQQGGAGSTVGALGGYGAIYCFAMAE